MDLSGRLLTKTERLILNNIALVLYDIKQERKAAAILKFLITYFETQTISETEKAKDYPVILFNLSNWKGIDGKYEEALDLSEKGIQECIIYGQLLVFPYLLFNKGYCLLGLKQIENGKKSIEHALNLMDEIGKHDDASFGMQKIKEIFGIDI
jgi:tetratricopeptide (TPR) repeat protein